MNDKFFDLKKEKQDKIINAALKIFSNNAYKHACTDDIVKEAGISKGLLFHYFGNKVGLYSFLYAYSTKYLSIELYQTIGIKETDYFELWKQVEYANYQAMRQYPYMPRFLERANIEAESEVAASIHDKRQERTKEYQNIYRRAEAFVCHPQMDKEKADHILKYTIEGIKEDYFKQENINPKELYQKIESYIELLKSLLIKA